MDSAGKWSEYMKKSSPVLVKNMYQSGEGNLKLISWVKTIEKGWTEDSNNLERAWNI